MHHSVTVSCRWTHYVFTWLGKRQSPGAMESCYVCIKWCSFKTEIKICMWKLF